ncbi:MAG: hypothetical protein E6G60_12800, partial [Actinobacteria bacterium]
MAAKAWEAGTLAHAAEEVLERLVKTHQRAASHGNPESGQPLEPIPVATELSELVVASHQAVAALPR